MSKPEIETTGSRIVYANRWMRVREDDIRRADGTTGIYGVIEKKDFAVIAAVQDGQIYLVEQFRYPVGARYWELPQGTWDADHHDPLALARAELREETGIEAGEMTHVGRLYLAYGMCTQACDVFVARELKFGPPALEEEEQGLISGAFGLAEFERMICDGVIVDGTTVAAWGLVRVKGVV